MRKLCGNCRFHRAVKSAEAVNLRPVVPRVGIEPTLLAERDFESRGEVMLGVGLRTIISATNGRMAPMGDSVGGSGLYSRGTGLRQTARHP